MDKHYLYLEIAEAIRKQIIEGSLHPGDKLPPMRDLTTQWNCAPGTVQRAYSMLAHEGLIVSRSGQGTQVLGKVDRAQSTTSIRKASLINKAESFLLEAIAAGFSETDIDTAVQAALDRWRSFKPNIDQPVENLIRFAGSHDPVLVELVREYSHKQPKDGFEVQFCGSLGGLIALSQDQVDLAGCHLWDESSNTYNIPFIYKLFPGRRVNLINLAIRQIGIALPPGNPYRILSLDQVTLPEVVWIDRQSGSGIRVWTDAQFKLLNVTHGKIIRHPQEALTHTQVAKWIAEGTANMGCCLEYTAREFDLDFIPLVKEQYDLITTGEINTGVFRRFIDFIASEFSRSLISARAGYDVTHSGEVSVIGS